MGYIDRFSDNTLYDVLDGNLTMDIVDGIPDGDNFEFYGFHIVPQNADGGVYDVQYDGHAGSVGKIHSDDYDDVLELVDDLMDYVFEVQHYDYQDDKEALVEWAGKIMTRNKERAEERPDLYIHIPDEPFNGE